MDESGIGPLAFVFPTIRKPNAATPHTTTAPPFADNRVTAPLHHAAKPFQTVVNKRTFEPLPATIGEDTASVAASVAPSPGIPLSVSRPAPAASMTLTSMGPSSRPVNAIRCVGLAAVEQMFAMSSSTRAT